MNKKIVFVTYGGGHVNMLLPVIKQLQKRSNLDLVVLGLTTAGATLKQNNIPYIGFKDLLADDNDYAREWGENLVNKDDLHPAISYQESVAYMGLSYVDLEIEHGTEKAAEIFADRGRLNFFPLNTLCKFLKAQRPNVVVATNSPRAEQSAITAAGKLNIPSICLVDLFMLHDQQKKILSQANYANKVCVISDFAKQNLISAGRDADDIIVTGNTAFDRAVEYRGKGGQFRIKKAWGKKSKVILWASKIESNDNSAAKFSTNLGLSSDIEKKLIDIVSTRENWILVIRPHPSEKNREESLLENVELSSPLDNLYELLSSVDVVVTIASTVGLEALLFDKPVITINLSPENNNSFFSKMDISHKVDNAVDLENTLEELLSGNNQTVYKNPCANVGSATINFLSVIEEYL